MEFSQIFGTIILGKMLSPIYKKSAKVTCQECEDFIEKGSKILDLGCGKGFITNTLKNYFKADILGVDIEDYRIVQGFPFQVYDGETLPFPDNSFDVVFLSYVLHHTEYPKKVISEAKRVTKDKVIVFEDLPEGIRGTLMAKVHTLTYSLVFRQEVSHYKTEKGWKKFFNELGLKTIFKKRMGSWILWFFPQKRAMFVLEKYTKDA